MESPTERALARARYQGPSPLPAVYGPGVDGHPVPTMLLSDGVVFSTAVTKPLEVQTDPASEGDQHFWRFAESEIASPTHLGSATL